MKKPTTADVSWFRLRRAVTKACDERGSPNTFTFGELHERYGAPPPRVSGKLMQAYRGVLFHVNSRGEIEVG